MIPKTLKIESPNKAKTKTPKRQPPKEKKNETRRIPCFGLTLADLGDALPHESVGQALAEQMVRFARARLTVSVRASTHESARSRAHLALKVREHARH